MQSMALKIKDRRKTLLCSRPNVQSGRSTVGLLVKMALQQIFCHYLRNSSGFLGSCKETTDWRAALLNDFLWWFSQCCFQPHFFPTSWRQAKSRLQIACRQSLLIMCLLKCIYFQMLLACTVIFKKHWNYNPLRAVRRLFQASANLWVGKPHWTVVSLDSW